MSLSRLLYVSRVCQDVRMSHAEEIAAAASAKNERLGITGYLVYSPRFFVQALEGERPVLDSLLASIRRDVRHSDVTTLWEGNAMSRLFEGWSMGVTGYGFFRSRDGRLLVELDHWDAQGAMELLLEARDADGRQAALGEGA